MIARTLNIRNILRNSFETPFVLQVKVSEEKRLATTVFTIDQEVSVVPRGAYIKSPHGTVQKNRSFEGMLGL